MIKPLTKEEFIYIATNGIAINLHGKYVEDYIENLVKFIEETTYDYYIADYDKDWCEVAKSGVSVLKVCFEKNRINFYLKAESSDLDSKKSAGEGIKIVYMHTVAWEAINNNGEINQRIEPWPI